MKIFVGVALLIILASLGSAFFFLMKDKSRSSRTVNALTVRITLSIALFLFILFAHHMGWIESTGLR
ncbi:twin transmembrane helix small protein [Limnobacter sp.]|uniref:twin transmembrane helix small protein n=1 Tax=Limnobacter sp. TaxID=2003368 RepID=UPI00258D37F5|nr:twin transmembrane helix small protein [Limnobacter sp.]HEX5486406.1 twin transmembrane helix small protein [Limnobacter sp.]